MWPFNSAESHERQLQREREDALERVTRKWLLFRQLRYEIGLSLAEQMGMFLGPAIAGLRLEKPSLSRFSSEELERIVVTAIANSGTHTEQELTRAIARLRADDR